MAVFPLPPPLWEHHRQTLQPILDHWKKTDQIPSALLLLGLDGVGKRSVAHALAQWIFCEKRSGCGTCSSCQKALSGHWLDFTEILSVSEEGVPQAIKLEHIEGLIASLGRSPFEASHRVVLINHADLMNSATANSLLKILEEPPAHIIFILTAATRSTLLPTLLSRCQPLALRPLPEEALRKSLSVVLGERELSREKLDFAVGIAYGSLGKALRFTQDAAWEAFLKVSAFMKSPPQEMSSLVEWSTAQPVRPGLVFDLLEFFSSQKILTDSKMALRIERIHKARSEILTPVNKKILFQDVLAGFL